MQFEMTAVWGPVASTVVKKIVEAPSIAVAYDHVKFDEKIAALPVDTRLMVTMRQVTP